MKYITMALVFGVLLFGKGFNEVVNAASCDVSAAVKIQGMLLDMGCFWTTAEDTVKFKWGSDWDHYERKQRLKMIETAANADACISGKVRSIKFYRRDILVGDASSFGIKLK